MRESWWNPVLHLARRRPHRTIREGLQCLQQLRPGQSKVQSMATLEFSVRACRDKRAVLNSARASGSGHGGVLIPCGNLPVSTMAGMDELRRPVRSRFLLDDLARVLSWIKASEASPETEVLASHQKEGKQTNCTDWPAFPNAHCTQIWFALPTCRSHIVDLLPCSLLTLRQPARFCFFLTSWPP